MENELKTNQNKKAVDIQTRLDTLEKELDTEYLGLITKVLPIDSKTFFNTDIYENREGVAIEVKLRNENEDIFQEFYAIPLDVRGLTQSNLYKFKQKYKQAPKKGMEINAKLNDTGFFEIVI